MCSKVISKSLDANCDVSTSTTSRAGGVQKVWHGPLDIDKDVKDEEVMAGEVMGKVEDKRKIDLRANVGSLLALCIIHRGIYADRISE